MLTPAQSMKIAMDSFETSMAAATTIGLRMPILFSAMLTGSPAAMRESNRMVSEKLTAAAEGAFASGAAVMQLWMQTAATMSAPTADQLSRCIDAGLAPARRACKANARRLSGKRRQTRR
jgi:hypothetical protein